MPYRKTVFSNDCYYHIYNRGVEKRTIFQNKKDYDTFLEILSWYLTPFENKWPKEIFSRKPKVKVSKGVELLCYCLMPNHFHLLVKQKNDNSITTLMHALGVTYSMYFNQKYHRVGSLFQGRFQAKMIKKDDYLLYLSKYIHLNPQKIYQKALSTYPYSSYQYYLEPKHSPRFLKPYDILSYFSKQNQTNNYLGFVERIAPDFEAIAPLLLD